jgi:hypothetical protein
MVDQAVVERVAPGLGGVETVREHVGNARQLCVNLKEFLAAKGLVQLAADVEAIDQRLATAAAGLARVRELVG